MRIWEKWDPKQNEKPVKNLKMASETQLFLNTSVKVEKQGPKQTEKPNTSSFSKGVVALHHKNYSVTSDS